MFDSNSTNLVPGDTNGVSDIFLHDRLTGVTTRESVTSAGAQSNGFSFLAGISADGSTGYFTTLATNLTGNEDTNGPTRGNSNNLTSFGWDVVVHALPPASP